MITKNTTLNELYDAARLSAATIVQSGENFRVKDLFRGVEWNRIPKGLRTKLGARFLHIPSQSELQYRQTVLQASDKLQHRLSYFLILSFYSVKPPDHSKNLPSPFHVLSPGFSVLYLPGQSESLTSCSGSLYVPSVTLNESSSTTVFTSFILYIFHHTPLFSENTDDIIFVSIVNVFTFIRKYFL